MQLQFSGTALAPFHQEPLKTNDDDPAFPEAVATGLTRPRPPVPKPIPLALRFVVFIVDGANVPVTFKFPLTARLPVTLVPVSGEKAEPASSGTYVSKPKAAPENVTPTYRRTSCPVVESFTVTR